MQTTVKNNLSEKYSKGTIVIHWLSLLLILGMIPIGSIMADLPAGPEKIQLYKVHFILGNLIFLLTLLRTWFFFKKPRPAKLETGSSFHNKLVIWIEYSFYWVLIFLALSGIITNITAELGEAVMTGDYNLLPTDMDFPSLEVHEILVKLLIALLIAHVLGVIMHYLRHKENTLKRILP